MLRDNHPTQYAFTRKRLLPEPSKHVMHSATSFRLIRTHRRDINAITHKLKILITKLVSLNRAKSDLFRELKTIRYDNYNGLEVSTKFLAKWIREVREK